MPSFKPKNSKNICVSQNSIVTLDGKHHQILDKLDENKKKKLPELEKKQEEIRKLLKRRNLSLDDKLDLKDKLCLVNKEINKITNEKKKYLLNNSEHIFSYFENKKEIASGNNKTTILDKYFKINTKKAELDTKEISTVEKYLTNIDDSFLDIKNYVCQTDICKKCQKGELIPIEHDGIMVCNHCFCNVQYLVENEKPSYKEPPKEVCFYAYKRINHFREILAQFQAKETTQIPQEVLDNIKLQIKKERMTLNQMTNKKAKDILKKLGYNKFYEHIPFIKDKLGIKPPIMSQELEETLCSLFMDIQAPYSKFCPNDRVNFLNYYYTVYKLCELLDQRQFLPYFPMLKDRDKRIEQDEVWKKICGELDWEFIPTI